MERPHDWACLLKASRSILCFVCGKFKCYLCLWLWFRGNHAALQDYAALAWVSSCRQEAEGNDFNLSVAGSRLLCERSNLVDFVSANLCQSAQCGSVPLHHINRCMKYKTRNTVNYIQPLKHLTYWGYSPMRLAIPVNECDNLVCKHRIELQFLYFEMGRTESYVFKSGTNTGMCEKGKNNESEVIPFEPFKLSTCIFCKIHQSGKEVIVYFETRVLAHFQNSSSEFSKKFYLASGYLLYCCIEPVVRNYNTTWNSLCNDK